MKHLLPLLLLFSFSGLAQDLLQCGADEMRISTLQINPTVAKAVVQRDAELEKFTRTFEGSAQRGGQTYTIPVVFHVIHKYGNENITREQLMDGLRIVNETFRKSRADTADIHPDFKPIHADCQIEFHLATKDPEGNCHSGINRIASTLTNVGDHQVKELIQWDPTRYLNVYVVANAAGLAGHCVWPADADTIPEWDGIVIAHNYVGTIGTSDLTRSVAFAHECGHYLNLHHIWGGNNVPGFYYLPVGEPSNCDEDDLVQDTPNTIGWSSCNLNAASCGNVRDNVQNAMDYSYCNIMFTEGQKTRMHACLNASFAGRNNLWTASNLSATGVAGPPSLCAADFVSDEQLLCGPGNAVNFTQTSFHGELDSVRWEFPGGEPSFSTVETPEVTYNQPGRYDVSLTVYANGASGQIIKQDHITVLSDSAWSYPFWDWFEGNNPLNASKWTAHSLDSDNTWQLTDEGFHSPSHSLMVDNWNNPYLTVDELYSLPIDISNASQMRLAFKYAFSAQEQPTTSTRLQVQVRKDCSSNWTTRLTVSGNSLLTAPVQQEPFAPQSPDLWVQEDINIPATYFGEHFMFRFVFTSEGNGRIFLDDVNVDVSAGIGQQLGHRAFSVYPNPTEGSLTVRFKPDEKPSMLRLWSADGRLVLQHPLGPGANTLRTETLDLSAFSPGLYCLELIGTNATSVQRIVLQ